MTVRQLFSSMRTGSAGWHCFLSGKRLWSTKPSQSASQSLNHASSRQSHDATTWHDAPTQSTCAVGLTMPVRQLFPWTRTSLGAPDGAWGVAAGAPSKAAGCVASFLKMWVAAGHRPSVTLPHIFHVARELDFVRGRPFCSCSPLPRRRGALEQARAHVELASRSVQPAQRNKPSTHPIQTLVDPTGF